MIAAYGVGKVGDTVTPGIGAKLQLEADPGALNTRQGRYTGYGGHRGNSVVIINTLNGLSKGGRLQPIIQVCSENNCSE